jgi:hypothetical protein
MFGLPESLGYRSRAVLPSAFAYIHANSEGTSICTTGSSIQRFRIRRGGVDFYTLIALLIAAVIAALIVWIIVPKD